MTCPLTFSVDSGASVDAYRANKDDRGAALACVKRERVDARGAFDGLGDGRIDVEAIGLTERNSLEASIFITGVQKVYYTGGDEDGRKKRSSLV